MDRHGSTAALSMLMLNVCFDAVSFHCRSLLKVLHNRGQSALLRVVNHRPVAIYRPGSRKYVKDQSTSGRSL